MSEHGKCPMGNHPRLAAFSVVTFLLVFLAHKLGLLYCARRARPQSSGGVCCSASAACLRSWSMMELTAEACAPCGASSRYFS